MRWLKYEYWPTWLFYLPVLPLYFWHALRLRSFVFFTWVNPSIQYGGFFGEEKDDILKQIPTAYKIPSLSIPLGYAPDKLFEKLKEMNWSYPLVAKPNVGERGKGVQIVSGDAELKSYLEEWKENLLIQPHVDGTEYGVFVVRCPESDRIRITSITGKVFMKVIGNGRSSILELLAEKDRFKRQIKRLKQARPELLEKVLENGEERIVEPIGNHCLGTEFTNEGHLINEKVISVFQKIVDEMDGFYYGRFDLRVSFPDSLETGKGLYIFELNGVASEPGHVYATSVSYFKAVKEVVSHWKYIFEIAKKIKSKQKNLYKARDIWKVTRNHFKTV
jgi:hypothetical protein